MVTLLRPGGWPPGFETSIATECRADAADRHACKSPAASAAEELVVGGRAREPELAVVEPTHRPDLRDRVAAEPGPRPVTCVAVGIEILPELVEQHRRVDVTAQGGEEAAQVIRPPVGSAGRLPAEHLPLGLGSAAAHVDGTASRREGLVRRIDFLRHVDRALRAQRAHQLLEQRPRLDRFKTEVQQPPQRCPACLPSQLHTYETDPFERLAVVVADRLLDRPQRDLPAALAAGGVLVEDVPRPRDPHGGLDEVIERCRLALFLGVPVLERHLSMRRCEIRWWVSSR